MVRTRRGVVSTPVKDNVIEPIQAHTAAGDHILAYPYSSMLYYLTGTHSPTAFDYYQPGMHTRDQALGFLSQLRAHPVRVIVYEPGFGNHIRESWPNTRAEDLASDPIADYIAQHYQPCAALDSAANFHYLLMIRKDLACQ